MNVFYVISNEQKDPGQETAKYIRKYLSDRGRTCYLRGRGGKTARGQYHYTDAKRIPEDVECVLVLGGDGTLLHAARDLVGRRLPLLGVNMGTLGYLAEVDRKNLPEVLDGLIADEYVIEERMMLSGAAWHQDRVLMSDMALNDIVITRNGRMRVVDFNIYVDGTFLYSYAADGIIVSTPTGSTGYSLSVGGPIISPASSMLLLTAIAPHTMNARPIVLPPDVEVVVEIGSGHEEDATDGAEATFDGDTSVKLNAGDRISITRAGKRTQLIKTKNTSFLELLREKMNK
ncbi:MAG: NAD(+)/NADH kinase [Lachnospiraceae bacterium]|nr:NAD(+)/NADH kinase [Lachnospiraceae bacterium]